MKNERKHSQGFLSSSAFMKEKQINGHSVHPIGIGTWGMGCGMYPDKTHYAVYGDEDLAIEAIRYAISLGQNHIDTAQIYGLGHTEEIVGQAIQGYDRSQLFIASKLWKSHLKGDAVLRAIEGMLARLQTAYLDLVYLHGYWDSYEPIHAQLQGLEKARQRGLIRAIGMSNVTLDQLKTSLNIAPIVAVQNYYSLINRSWITPEYLSFCEDRNIAIIAARPLELGAVSSLSLLYPLCEKYRVSPSQIALAWLVNQPSVHAIPKAIDKRHIEENVSSVFEISSEDMTLLQHAFPSNRSV